MKIAIYSRGGESVDVNDLKILLSALQEGKCIACLYQDYFNQVKDHLPSADVYDTFSTSDDLDDSFDCMISLGGDGTLLDTVTLIREKNIPVLGVNFGRLGFLASLGKEDIQTAVTALIERTFVIEKRTLIHLDADIPLFGETPYALNEFAIHKRETSPMIKIHTYLNGEFLNTYWADGLIVSTPTGSTGYSLSCNGPVVFPESGSFVITPVAPHNLNVRPIVIPDNNIISFEVEGRMDQFICALDSRKETVDRTVQLAVRKESFTISLVRLNESNFLQTLRKKLAWGFDTRN
ncbi:MAG TPA: NAD kinase [Chitinophagaceae bacterium]|nr:NAD kinase [Chitinophagaceae bacterium]